jgi:DDE_Tnp_1-associated
VTEEDGAAGAVRETTVFLSHFEALPDYRQRGKIAYRLDEVLLVMLAAALAGRKRWSKSIRPGKHTFERNTWRKIDIVLTRPPFAFAGFPPDLSGERRRTESR